MVGEWASLPKELRRMVPEAAGQQEEGGFGFSRPERLGRPLRYRTRLSLGKGRKQAPPVPYRSESTHSHPLGDRNKSSDREPPDSVGWQVRVENHKASAPSPAVSFAGVSPGGSTATLGVAKKVRVWWRGQRSRHLSSASCAQQRHRV